MSFRIRTIDPIAQAALNGAQWQYADTFEITLDEPDDHRADEWLQAALEHTSRSARVLVRLVHRHVVRFDLDDDPASPLFTGAARAITPGAGSASPGQAGHLLA